MTDETTTETNEQANEDANNSEKVILCNDPVCEGDSLADKLEEANMNLEIANEDANNSEKVILCNDPVCEGDSLADKLEEANMNLEIANEEISNLKGELETVKNQPTTEPSEELEKANAKVAKLLSIVNLECGDLERMRAGTVQKMQMAEFYKSFPEMK